MRRKKKSRSRGMLWVAALFSVCLLVTGLPTRAGAPSVADTAWEGSGTLLLKVRGEGRQKIPVRCKALFHEDGTFQWELVDETALPDREGTEEGTWSQHGKRIRIAFQDVLLRDALAWAFQETTGLDAADATVGHYRSRARLRPKKNTLAWSWKVRGKVQAEESAAETADGSGKYRTVFKLKCRGMKQID